MKIGISQRVEVISRYNERRDCLDQRWQYLLSELGYLAVPISNSFLEPMDALEQLKLDGFLLTGGNDLSFLKDANNSAPERDSTEKAILEYAQLKQLPVFGVCRGLQMINIFCSGSLSPVIGHVATRHQVKQSKGATLLLPHKEVNSFHNWGLYYEHLGTGLNTELFALDGSIEAVRHNKLPWVGIMWHPEREEPFSQGDLDLINNIFNCKL